MSYSIDTTTKFIRVVYEGTLETKDIQGVLKDTLIAEGEKLNGINRIDDLRKLKGIAIGFTELSGFTESLRKIQIPKIVKSAILTSSPIQYGTARMFQIILDHPKVQVAIFSNEEEAHNWLSAVD
jgi:hypothetical protein